MNRNSKQVLIGRQRLAFLAMAVTGALSVSGRATASDYTFIVPPAGGMAQPEAWLEGVTPAGDPSANLFFGAGTYAVNQNIPDFIVRTLNISNSNPGQTVSFTGFSNLTLSGPGAGIYLTGGSSNTDEINLQTQGDVTFSNSGDGYLKLGTLILGDGVISVTNSGSGTIQLPDSATVPWYQTGTSVSLDLYNTGTGQLLLGNNSATTALLNTGFTGRISIKAGLVKASNPGGDLFGPNTILNVEAGATFDLNNNGEEMGGLEGGGRVILGTGGMTFFNAANRTFSGTLEGSGGITHRNNQTLTFASQFNPLGLYTGTVALSNGGTFSLTVPNAFLNTPLVVANGNLFFNGLDQTFAGLTGGSDNGFLENNGTLTLNGDSSTRLWGTPIIGTGNVVVNTAGTQALLGNSTYTGFTRVEAGRLVATYAGLVNSSSVTVNSGAALTVVVPTDTVWGIPVDNTGGFTKGGAGVLTFNNSALAMSLTSLGIDRGGIVIDRSSDNGEMLGSSPALTLGTGSLRLIGNNAAATSKDFSSTVLRGGAKVAVEAGSGQSATLSLGAISHLPGFGGSLNVSTNAGGVVTTTSQNNAGGILGGYATFNGTDWASVDSGSVVPLQASSYTANGWGANVKSDISGSYNAPTGTPTGSVRFNTSSASTLVVTGNTTISYGGILVTPNVGANAATITSAATGGTLIAPSGQSFQIHQHNTAGELTISSIIGNVAGPAVTKSATLATTAHSQIITIDSTADIALGALVTGSVFTSTANAHVVEILSPTQIRVAYSSAPTGATTTNLTFTHQTDVVKNGPGTLVLTAGNTFRGMLVLNEGTVRAGVPTTMGVAANTGSSSLLFNGGRLEATANIPSVGGTQHWIVGPAGGELYVGEGLTVTKQGNSFFGTGDLVKTGPGTFSIGNNLSYYTGNMIVEAGTLRLTSNQLRLSSGIEIKDGAQFRLTDTTSGPFQVGPGGVLKIGGQGPAGTGAWYHELDEAGSANYAFNSPIILTSTARFVTLNRPNTADTNTDIFPLPVSGPGSFIKDGNGTVVLSNAFNSYGGTQGSTIISQGTLRNGVNNALPTSTSLQFGEVGSSNSGVYDLAGYNQTVASLTNVGGGTDHKIVSASTNTATAVLTINYNGTVAQTFTGRVGESGSNSNLAIVKTGTGTLSLLGSTAYTGSATAAEGTLRVGNSDVARSYIVADGATLSFVNQTGGILNATSLTAGSTSSGTSTLAFEFLANNPTGGALQVGTDGLTLNGTVAVQISSVQGLTIGSFPLIRYDGAIQGAGFSAIASSLVLPNRVTGTLIHNVANHSIDLSITSVDFLRWQGNLSGNWDISSTANFSIASTNAPATYTDQPGPDSVVFDSSASGTSTVNLTTTLRPASVEVSGTRDYVFTGPGKLSSATGISKFGSGKLTILTNNDNTGQTIISAGEIQVGNGGTTGQLGSGAVTNNGQLTFHRSDDVTFAANISGSGSLTKLGSNTLILDGAVNLSGPVTVAGGSLGLSAGKLSGNVSGAGNLIKNGVGTMTFTGNVYTSSPTLVNAGSVQIGDGGGSGTLSNDVQVAAGAYLAFHRDNYTFSNAITGSGGLAVLGGNLTLTGNLTYTGQTQINSSTLEIASPTNTTLRSPVSGTDNSTLIKSGSGTLTLLNNNNTFTGRLLVNGGTVLLADLGAGGDIGAREIIVNNGGTFIFGQGGVLGENPDIQQSTLLQVNQGGTFEIRVSEDIGRTRLAGGALLLNASLNNTGTTGDFLGVEVESGTIAASGSYNLGTATGVVDGGGSFRKYTNGKVTITGGVGIAGTLPIDFQEGVIAIDPSSFGRSTGTADFRMGNGSSPVLLDIVGTGSGTNARPVQLNSELTINVNQPNASVTFSGNINGDRPLNKTGPGTVVFSGDLNYRGDTTISGGLLQMNKSLRPVTSSLVVTGTGRAVLNVPSSSSAYAVAAELNNISITEGSSLAVTPRTPGDRAKVLVANSINLYDLSGSIDLASNDMIIRNASESTIRGMVANWWNNGLRDGTTGIISSTAGKVPGNDMLATLAVASNDNGLGGSYFSSFDGVSVSSTDILVKYTFIGDTNLSGTVDTDDLQAVISGIRNGSTGWRNGDTNYDGVVDANDLANVLKILSLTSGQTFGSPSQVNVPSSGGAVPEPSSALALLAAAPMLGRRRRA